MVDYESDLKSRIAIQRAGKHCFVLEKVKLEGKFNMEYGKDPKLMFWKPHMKIEVFILYHFIIDKALLRL